LVIKNSSEYMAFIPDEQEVRAYNFYQVLGNDIVVLDNGEMKVLNIDTDLPVYSKTTLTTLKAVTSTLTLGDTIDLYYTNGQLDYGVVKTDTLSPVYTVKSASWANELELNNPIVVRDGVKVTVSDVKANDVLYYSKPLSLVWAYSKKITGIYEKAAPNKDNPTKVTISGVDYDIEGVQAFNKLSSNGDINYGDTVTVMLGKNGAVADVLTNADSGDTMVGYLIENGKKEFTDNDGKKFISFYVKLALSDGTEGQYTVSKDYSNLKNRVVKISFKNKTVTASGSSSFSGTVVDGNVAGLSFSPSMKVIDVTTVYSNENGTYTYVFPQRLEGVELNNRNVLYYEKNAQNQITSLFLNDVTGDCYGYGIVTKSPSKASNESTAASSRSISGSSGSYTYDTNGVSGTVSGNFSVIAGQPSRFKVINDKVEGITGLIKLNQTVTKINYDSLETENESYTLSENVVVYVRADMYSYSFLKIPKEDIIGNSGYTYNAFYDKAEVNGGRIRVILANKK
jgi:hypothetical protein